MKAVQYCEYGGTEVLALVDISVPEIGPDEVLVKVCASSVNPADWKFRAGWFAHWVSLRMPFIPGADVAGIVEKVGALASGYKPGDRVYGMKMVNVGGACAEYAVLRADELAHAPASVPLENSAGAPLAALTAWCAIFDGAALSSGQTILVQAASGGVGSFAVQLAKVAGAHVIATCSAANADLVRSLGADQVIDYRSVEFSTVVKDVDVVLDAWGGEAQEKFMATLRKGGTLVTLDPVPPPPELCEAHGVGGIAAALTPNGARLAQLAALIDAGKVRVVVDREFSLGETAAAHACSEIGHARGKIIIRVG